ncbi:NADPH-dependent aldehyde reductase 1, chloroplastic [Turnera subulata]|uniref:NADPH-dependent aldehyde reductase 1, chloroplastic n=1 Tax=Turnera subulata TaxID=218843 RepID=A0A9Q0J323_9ROSI|nr:NADPH-dependent aldehyde reductase 1, chloroplastic [Turnera subulata]
MATDGAQARPTHGAQAQPQQPGVEYLMHPRPVSIDPEYQPSNKLQGKVALITGGDSGIGRSVSYYFALEGAVVAFTYVAGIEDKDKDETLKTIKELTKGRCGKGPIAIPTDVRFEENCKKVVDQVVGELGGIDILVNNAGYQHFNRTVEEITEDRLERTFRTNIFAHFFMIKHALAHMKEGSSIVNTASVVAYQGTSWVLEYSSTKGAIVAFTRSLSQFLVDRKIRVNGVAPGPIWTPLEVSAGAVPPEVLATFGSDVPMKRPGQPCEIAPSFVFLASNQMSSYMTGQVLHPNGGTIING